MSAVDPIPRDAGAGRRSRVAAWTAVLALTAALTALSTSQSLARYRALRSGWSWDLAYYNQWNWALTLGDGTITVRPMASYAVEGPSVFKTNYFAPVRFVLAPVYRLAPDPRTLLVIHNVVVWWVVPAAFMLVRSEGRSTRLALAGAGLVPLTPLLWPIVWNDFREIQMALPFVLWSVQGVPSRRPRLAACGIGGMLACRQEMAAVVISLAILPPREPEDVGRTYRWAHALIVTGVSWLLLVFFGHLRVAYGRGSVLLYIEQFLGPRAPLRDTLVTSAEFLLVGLGAWAVFLVVAPRAAVLVVPWLWSLAGGRWSLRYLSAEQWHHVRYTSPFVAVGLAAGLIGFARVGQWLLRKRRGGLWLAAVWALAAAVSAQSLGEALNRMDRQNEPIGPEEARAVWRWVRQVGPDEGVLAAYEVTAPLSSRRTLFSYVLIGNRPPRYPELDRRFQWVFWRNRDGATQVFESQGFRVVHRGPFLTVLRRERGAGPAGPK